MSGPDATTRAWADSPYTRVYHTLPERMGADWADLEFVGAWLKLLLAADASYPLAPSLPRWLDAPLQDRLVAAGMVHLVDGENYTIAGLQQERQARIEGRAIGGHVRAAGAARSEDGRFLPAAQQPASKGQQTPASAQQPSNTQAEAEQETEPRESPRPYLGVAPSDPRYPVARVLATRFRFRRVDKKQWQALWECIDNEYPRGTSRGADPGLGWRWAAALMQSLAPDGGDPIGAVFAEVARLQHDRAEAAG